MERWNMIESVDVIAGLNYQTENLLYRRERI